MQLWRLSTRHHARSFDGGYGLANDGRWNTVGRPVTYASTVASLSALEKRVHVLSPGLLPPLEMVEFEVPDGTPIATLDPATLPADWIRRQAHTQALGDQWLDAVTAAILLVPSAIVALANAPDLNGLVNHRHPRTAGITIKAITPFTLDPRLF
ncbi:MAG: RES family NAD+ phosphorylase [Proteobacteria bacterium]|nr:RES family NAD+ phosphorylase [Pseudomonadota bacterium]